MNEWMILFKSAMSRRIIITLNLPDNFRYVTHVSDRASLNKHVTYQQTIHEGFIPLCDKL